MKFNLFSIQWEFTQYLFNSIPFNSPYNFSRQNCLQFKIVIEFSFRSLRRCIGLFQKISTPPIWATLNWVLKNFRISKKGSSSLCGIPNPADSNSWGNSRILQNFARFCWNSDQDSQNVRKIHGILVKLTDHLWKCPHPLYGRHWIGYLKISGFPRRAVAVYAGFQTLLIQILGGIPEFCKILQGFTGIPIKIHKMLGKFMEFQSGSPIIYDRVSNVVHGGCVDIFWNGPL